MKKLEDITYRHELIERYLDADTSVEEEQALADFYRHCEDKDLTCLLYTSDEENGEHQ